MKNEHSVLIELLEADSYDYSFDNDTLIFRDERIYDIEQWYVNQKLYEAIRADKKIRILDLSFCPKVPKLISNFPYVEEIKMPTLRNEIPTIKGCPNLYNIEFNSNTIVWLKRDSFKGWPAMDCIKFSSSLIHIDSFALACKAKIIDLSACVHLTIDDHCFQGNTSIRKCILPSSIAVLPNYAFMNCVNLTTLIAPGIKTIYKKSLSGNLRLRRIEFSDKVEPDKIVRLLSSDDFLQNYNSPHSGIILDVDEEYMYIFSFVNFKFYCAVRNNNLKKLDFVSFYHDISFMHSVDKGGMSLYRKNDDYLAIELSDLNLSGSYHFSHKYTGNITSGLCVKTNNLQEKAYKVLTHEIKDMLNSDLRTKVSEIVNNVESLDMNKIIESYHTEINEWVRTKIGGDDTFYSCISRGSIYNDPYLETILPTYYSYDKESAYTTKWDYTDKTKWMRDDEKYRKEALKKYSKEDHITFLLKDFIHSIVLDAIRSEKYLHISRAIEVLEQVKFLVGKRRIEILNENFYL